MAKIKHIAIATQDPDKAAKFYREVFDLKEIAKLDGPSASGYFLSDGNINLAILKFKNDESAGVELGKDYSGLHHIGFHVESLEETTGKLESANYHPRDDINKALGLSMGQPRPSNLEIKYDGPDSVIIDISVHGWEGTSG